MSAEEKVGQLLSNGEISLDAAIEMLKAIKQQGTHVGTPWGSVSNWWAEEMEKRREQLRLCPCNPANGGSGICAKAY